MNVVIYTEILFNVNFKILHFNIIHITYYKKISYSVWNKIISTSKKEII